jgi:exonuclease III
MNCLSWNCRGLGNPWTVQDLCRMVRDKKPDVVFLMETKMRRRKMENIRIKLGFTCMFVVDCVGKSEGLSLFWGENMKVEIKNFSHRHIGATINEPGADLCWKFTGFYGHPEMPKRHEAWSLLKYLAQSDPLPWLCIGDFNEVANGTEKWGGSMRNRSGMIDFQQTLEACKLTDLGFCGPKYTWSNCREGRDFIKERLDRGVANEEWRKCFPEAVISMEVAISSDHAPLFLYLKKFIWRKKRKKMLAL